MLSTTGSIRFDKLVEIAMAIAPDIDCTNKHISFVLNKHRIITIGQNTNKTHPLCVKYGYPLLGVHSEMSCLIKAGQNISGLTLVNIRLSGDSFRRLRVPVLRNSRPCKYCLPWCRAMFKRIFYTTNEGFVQL